MHGPTVLQSLDMRIVQLINELAFGGAEKLVADLSTSLVRRGHEVTIVCLRALGEDPVDVRPFLDAGGQILELQKPPGLHFQTLSKLRRFLVENEVAVVHSHNHLVHHYAAFAGRLAGVPAILTTLHGSASLCESPWWTRALYRLSGMVGDRVVAVGCDVRNVLHATLRFPAYKVLTIANGIDFAPFTRVRRESVPRSEFVFGAVGRLEPVKDHSNLLTSFAQLYRHHPCVRLRVLGNGSLMSKLQQQARELRIDAAVSFEGFRLDTHAFLSEIDVFVLSSRSEGLPLSLLEAMAVGLPIVATTVGDVPELVTLAECGWLVPPNQPQALADAMERALLAQDLRDRGQRARELVLSRYSLDGMTAIYERLYVDLIENASDRTRGRRRGEAT